MLEEAHKGSLEITIPRNLIDAKIGESDDKFFVLIDGLEVPYTEVTDESQRTLTIQFEEDARIIQVFGTQSSS